MVLNTVAPRARQQLERLQTATAGQWHLLLAGYLCGRLSMWLTRTTSASAKQFQLQFMISSLSYGEIKCLTKSCIPQNCKLSSYRWWTIYPLLFLFIPHSASVISLGRQLPTSRITIINPSLRDWRTADDWIPAVCDEVWWSTLQNAP